MRLRHLLLLATLASAAGCRLLGIGLPCTASTDCPPGQSCAAAGECTFAAVDAGEGEGGEGEAAGEGEGGEGEGGEGEGGEGEGGEGEGEGEGDAAGEGEGEGEGEGDGCVPVGHDEDGDGVDDACDDCPGDADVSQDDLGEVNAGAIADGVGDACDPRPAVGGDVLLLFDPFTRSALDPSWSVTGTATYAFDGEHLLTNGFQSTGDPYVVFPVAAGDVAVQTRARFTNVDGFDSDIFAGMRSSAAGGYEGYVCGPMDQGGGAVLELAAYLSPGGNYAFLDERTAATVPLGRTVAIRSAAAGGSLACSIDGVALAASEATYASGAAAIGVYHAAASFDYVAVYGVVP